MWEAVAGIEEVISWWHVAALAAILAVALARLGVELIFHVYMWLRETLG